MRTAVINVGSRRQHGTHPGLILQRFLANQSSSERNSERVALLAAARQACRSEALRSIYAEAFARWERSFPADKSCRAERLSTQGRLIVGLGAENVLEAGLRLHHTYGVPIIPGSALKGLASHYCHEVWGQPSNPSVPEENKPFRRGGQYHSLLFGTSDDGGVITFHDAWITPESLDADALRLDVMTPHHPDWQMGKAPPTDFDSPVPVPFLSVAGTFDIRLSWSGPADAAQEKGEAWTGLAMELLAEALGARDAEDGSVGGWGVGAKTSSGYGRLVRSGPAREVRRPSPSGARRSELPRPGDRVEARLLAEKTRNGGWKAMHEPTGLSGPIQNSSDVPSDQQTSAVLQLIVASATERGIDFRYPTPAVEARAQRNRGSGPGRRHGRPRR